MSLPTPQIPPILARIFEMIRAHTEDEPRARGMDPRENEEHFNSLSLELFRFQIAHNTPYRKWCESRGVLRRAPVRWTEIPCVPAASFKEVDWSCIPAESRTHVFHSSGTTEQRPSRHFHNPASLELYEASLLSGFNTHLLADLEELVDGDLLRPLEKPCMLLLTPPAHSVPHSSLAHMLASVQRSSASSDSLFVGILEDAGAWALDLDRTHLALRKSIGANRPLWIVGTAFNFVHLLDFMREQSLRYCLAPGSRVMETGGYKGRSRVLLKGELHSLMTRHLGIPDSHIVCEYGMSELSSQAYDRTVRTKRGTSPSPRRLKFPPWARVRIVSPETGHEVAEGETGMIRILDLANAYSVMAVQTEDLGKRWEDGFELTGRATASESRGCSLMSGESLA